MNEASQNCDPADAAPAPTNEFSESRGLHLPIHRMLNSLTWYLIFDVQTAFVTNMYIDGLPLLPPSSSVSELTEVLPPRLQSSFLPQIKLNSQLSRCDYILVDTLKKKKMIQDRHTTRMSWKRQRLEGCSHKPRDAENFRLLSEVIKQQRKFHPER